MRPFRFRLLALASLLLTLVACSIGGSAGSEAAGVGLALGPAPWKNGDVARYDIIDKSGKKVGSDVFSFSLSGAAWVISDHTQGSNFEQQAQVRLDAASLQPLGEEKTVKADKTNYTLSTVYSRGKLVINAVVNGQKRNATISVPANGLDNDQLLMTLRALQFSDGYVAQFTNVVAANALKLATTVRVLGRETIQVPAGSFDCWKVELDFGQAKQYVWYDTAGQHDMVQYDNGATKSVLTR